MDNSWHHFCFTWRSDTGNTRLFADGSLRVDETSIAVGQTIAANGVFNLGKKSDNNKAFFGSMSGVNIWSTALSGYAISAMAKGTGYEIGDVLAWDALNESTIHGGVVVQPTDHIKSKGKVHAKHP